jgi:DNA polymerase III delta prime subunit
MPYDIRLESLSHHAYGLVGGSSIADELILILEREHGITSRGNPDFFNRRYANFTIDDARELRSGHEMMPVSASGKKIFIMAMDGITVEAQNALLKLLEEPAGYAHFFMIIPSAHLLLPTVRSRIRFIEIGNGRTGGEMLISEEAKKFLKMPPAKRLESVKSLTDDIKDGKKTKKDAIDLLNAVQSLVYEEKGVVKGRRPLEAIETARRYMDDAAPSLKMLLEYVALNI